MSYLIAGLWHCAAALAFAAALGVLQCGDVTYWLHSGAFDVALVVASCALFFIPDAYARKGLWKYLHYPLPDWDVLVLGPASHRHWLTHSPLLPALLYGAAWQYPAVLSPSLPLAALFAGLSLGIGSHLFWDCVSSRSHKVVIVPYWLALRPAASRIYLLLGAALSLGAAAYFAVATSHTSASRPAPLVHRPPVTGGLVLRPGSAPDGVFR